MKPTTLNIDQPEGDPFPAFLMRKIILSQKTHSRFISAPDIPVVYKIIRYIRKNFLKCDMISVLQSSLNIQVTNSDFTVTHFLAHCLLKLYIYCWCCIFSPETIRGCGFCNETVVKVVNTGLIYILF